MARTDPQVNLRIPADLKAMLEDAARKSGRTLTTETITRLRQTFEAPDVEARTKLIRELVITEVDRAMREINDGSSNRPGLIGGSIAKKKKS